jgi:protein TonB
MRRRGGVPWSVIATAALMAVAAAAGGGEADEEPIVPPQPLERPAPKYPGPAIRDRVSGTVELDVLVDETGRVVEVARKAGSGAFVDASVAAVRTWVYRPATQAGRPVRAWVPVRIVFSARDASVRPAGRRSPP